MRRVNKITRELLKDALQTEKLVAMVRLAVIQECNKKHKK
jgi:hypothetical protein